VVNGETTVAVSVASVQPNLATTSTVTVQVDVNQDTKPPAYAQSVCTRTYAICNTMSLCFCIF